MMNKSVKNDFIKQRNTEATLHDGFLQRIFTEKVSPYEDIFQKDACDFSIANIIEMYKAWSMTSIESLASIHSQLIQYGNYCLQRNMIADAQNHYSDIDVNSLMNCINVIALKHKIVTREEVLSNLNKLNNATDCFIVLSLFEGFAGHDHVDVIYAKMSDFDTENKIFNTHTCRQIKYSTALYEYANQAMEEDKYVSERNGHLLSKTLVQSPYIVRYPVYKNRKENIDEFQLGRTIYLRCAKAFKTAFNNPTLKIKDLQISGEIEFINEEAKSLGMSGEEYMLNGHCLDRVNYQYNDYITRSLFIKKFSDYLYKKA